MKLRAHLDADRFLDVFFNERNGRTGLALIVGGRRAFGYDKEAGTSTPSGRPSGMMRVSNPPSRISSASP